MPQAIDEQVIAAKSQGNQSMDLNHPPMKPIPHQEFPKMLFMWPKDKKLSPSSKTAIANDAKEEKAMLAKGWRLQPHKQEFDEELPDGFEADISKTA